MAGGVVDGENVSAAVVNPAFINKNGDDTTPSNLGLASTNPAYGSSITSTQREHNAHASAIGISVNQVYNFLITWANNIVGVANDTIVARIQAVVLKFKGTTGGGGHAHSGTDGDGAQILGTNIASGSATNGQALTANGSGGATWANQTGSGGGGSLQWIEGTNAPIAMLDGANNNVRIYSYQAGLSQYLTATIKVPNSYNSGTQINLRSLIYTSNSSGTMLINTVSTLIRTGTDAISSSTNQRTSTNSAITLGAGTVNIPQAITCDLTDSTGKINGVAVSAGDSIEIQLQRGTDTVTSDVSALVYSTEITNP